MKRSNSLGAVAAACCALFGAGPERASAETTCEFSGGVLSVGVTPGELNGNGGFNRFPNGQIWNGSCFFKFFNTVTNTDRIEFSDASGTGTWVQFDLSGGPLAPGLTDEGDGTSELEIDLDLGFGDTTEDEQVSDFDPVNDRLIIDLQRVQSHEVRLGQQSGRTWLNLNAGEEGNRAPDLDVAVSGLTFFTGIDPRFARIDGEYISLNTYGGDDRIYGNGGPGFSGPSAVPFRARAGGGDNSVTGTAAGDSIGADDGEDVLKGGPGNDGLESNRGNDVLKGGPGNDRMDGGAGKDKLVGGPGKDEMVGKGGRDVFKARDGKRDSIDCGPGKDKVLADRKDRVKRNCEKVKRR